MTPTTEAGRRLLDEQVRVYEADEGRKPLPSWVNSWRKAILAIEAEAREQERARWRPAAEAVVQHYTGRHAQTATCQWDDHIGNLRAIIGEKQP